MKNRLIVSFLVGLAASLTACTDDAVTGPGFKCDVTNPVSDVILRASGGVILVHSPAQAGDTIQLSVVTTNRLGGQRTDVPVAFTSSDTTVATVDSLGVVHAVAPGTAKIKASSCGESSTVDVTVIANVSRVTVTPANDTVVVGDTATFIARAFGPDDSRVPGVKFTFGAANASVVLVNDSTARVVPTASGPITVQAIGEGVTGTAALTALARVFLSPINGVTNTIDVGDAYACGLISTGQGFCWGMNTHGQVGAATDSTCFPGTDAGTVVNDSLQSTAVPCSLVPLRVSQTLEFRTISSGDATACAISIAGRAYCWGFGTHGENGNGTTGDRAAPTLVTAALNFTSISVGSSHACAIATGGGAFCWGDDTFGQLGDRRTVSSTTPIPVVDITGDFAPGIFASISAGYQHTCALTNDGTAYCWGRNNFGQLGTGNTVTIDWPTPVATSLKFSSISAGGDHTCGITPGGAAFCWGSNAVGQLGLGGIGGASTVPVAVAGGQTFSRISASSGTSFKGGIGLGHTCGVTTAGAIYCWGDDSDLQLGRGPFTGGNGFSGTPTQVGQGERGPGTYTAISTGSRSSCAVGSDGNAYCWGSDVMGALGNTFQAAFRGFPQRVATPR